MKFLCSKKCLNESYRFLHKKRNALLQIRILRYGIIECLLSAYLKQAGIDLEKLSYEQFAIIMLGVTFALRKSLALGTLKVQEDERNEFCSETCEIIKMAFPYEMVKRTLETITILTTQDDVKDMMNRLIKKGWTEYEAYSNLLSLTVASLVEEYGHDNVKIDDDALCAFYQCAENGFD